MTSNPQQLIDDWSMVPSQFGGWPEIPNTSNTLNFSAPDAIQLPRLPPEIPFFKLHNTAIPFYSSTTKVQHLYLIDNPFLEYIEVLPEGLVNLELSDLPSLQYIDEFPSTLKYLTIKDCDSFITLPPFPKGLRVFIMENCSSVKFIPQQVGAGSLPPIKFMSVHNCPSLVVRCRPRVKNSLYRSLEYGVEFYEAARYKKSYPDNPLDDPYEPDYRNLWDEYYAV